MTRADSDDDYPDYGQPEGDEELNLQITDEDRVPLELFDAVLA